ncbi:hypothetical protein THAOC_28583 [Thalassiosira oceanica]|uniref:Uncharacterized protein n=1 Tax=Thalassiosira oceanica TaxID=159749 RepID=K0REP7_THAOC|nr:hypothetical protein THAOC_28583 [Thalassiosira oceanica]|eukprot:EJK52178.1 hypothetical protein THAOC_28583 [Thalassiosira oceanica]
MYEYSSNLKARNFRWGLMGAFMLEQIFKLREEALIREQGAVTMGAEGDALFVADGEVHQGRSDRAMFRSPQVIHDVKLVFQFASPRMVDIRANA